MTKAVSHVLVLVLLTLLIPDTAPQAAGRTYVPQYIKEDKKKRNRRTETTAHHCWAILALLL